MSELAPYSSKFCPDSPRNLFQPCQIKLQVQLNEFYRAVRSDFRCLKGCSPKVENTWRVRIRVGYKGLSMIATFILISVVTVITSLLDRGRWFVSGTWVAVCEELTRRIGAGFTRMRLKAIIITTTPSKIGLSPESSNEPKFGGHVKTSAE